MTNDKKDKIIGGIIVAILFGVPLAILFGPIAIIVFIVTVVTGLSRKKKCTPPKRTGQQLDDELITVVLPTINCKI